MRRNLQTEGTKITLSPAIISPLSHELNPTRMTCVEASKILLSPSHTDNVALSRFYYCYYAYYKALNEARNYHSELYKKSP